MEKSTSGPSFREGIRLHAANLAKPLHLRQGLPPEQVVDSVEHRPRVRLNCDATCGRAISKYNAAMMEITDAHDA